MTAKKNHTIRGPESDVRRWETAAATLGWEKTAWACHWLNLAASGEFRPILTRRQHPLGQVTPDEETIQFQLRVSADDLDRWTDAALASPCVHVKKNGEISPTIRDRSEWQRQVLNAAADLTLAQSA